jgi:hypothetical protein
VKKSGVLVVLVIFALTLSGALGVAQADSTISFDLVPASAAVAACLPDATGHVTVALKEETRGVDTLHLTASGLPPDTDFAAFLTSADAFATPAFGAVQYIGDFTTNAAGIGKLKVDAIIAEAFVSTIVNGARHREDLDHLVFWFADPNQAQATCGLTNTTPFDGDGNAGPAAMSSQGATGLEQFPE